MPREYQFPFELRHLVYFHEVARQLHFRRAAEALLVAQPALSRQIAQFEKALGVALFARTSRRVELTPAGRALEQQVEPLLRSLNAVPSALRAAAEGRVGLVKVAFTGLAMATVLPRILREFHRKHTGIHLELNESPTSAQLKALGDFGRKVGLAFQIIDDILDVTQTSEQLGKTAGKDRQARKATYPAIVGLEKSRKMAENLTARAFAALRVFKGQARALEALAAHLLRRDR